MFSSASVFDVCVSGHSRNTTSRGGEKEGAAHEGTHRPASTTGVVHPFTRPTDPSGP